MVWGRPCYWRSPSTRPQPLGRWWEARFLWEDSPIEENSNRDWLSISCYNCNYNHTRRYHQTQMKTHKTQRRNKFISENLFWLVDSGFQELREIHPLIGGDHWRSSRAQLLTMVHTPLSDVMIVVLVMMMMLMAVTLMMALFSVQFKSLHVKKLGQV